MAKGTVVKASRLLAGLKFGALATSAVLGAVLFTATQPPQRAHASPTGVIVLNQGTCVALGSAFAGIDATAAASDCQAMATQGANTSSPGFQNYVQALTKQNRPPCNAPDTSLCPPPTIIKPTPGDFSVLDLDANQTHQGQPLIVLAFVNDGFPVHFKTDKGNFIRNDGSVIGKDYYCNTAFSAVGVGDPDCATTANADGDGVVATRLRVLSADDYDPNNDENNIGHITVIQEGIGFPVDFTVVGPPETITLTPLFGKDTISTGALPPTVADALQTAVECPFTVCGPLKTGVAPDTRNCDFSASVGGVLGAVNAAEKTVVVVKALDNEGHAVVGALINWDHPMLARSDSTLGKTFVPTKQGGVALSQTPTVDTGSLGIGFPQFVCGLDEPGDLVNNLWFAGTLDDLTPAAAAEKASITIHVVKPAASFTLAADPATIDCNGTTSSKVTATVSNADGDPVANGLDINFSVVALGIATPLKADSAAGTGSTTVTPLEGSNSLTSDGGPAGVTVTVSVGGKRTRPTLRDDQPLEIRGGEAGRYDLYRTDYGEQVIIQNQILVACSGGPPPPAQQNAAAAAAAAAASSRPVGTISGPDTGSGGNGASQPGGVSLWALVALLGGAAAAASVGRLAGRKL
jgi:hypothetical protein